MEALEQSVTDAKGRRGTRRPSPAKRNHARADQDAEAKKAAAKKTAAKKTA